MMRLLHDARDGDDDGDDDDGDDERDGDEDDEDASLDNDGVRDRRYEPRDGDEEEERRARAMDALSVEYSSRRLTMIYGVAQRTAPR